MAESDAALMQVSVGAFSEQAEVLLSYLGQWLYLVYCLPGEYLAPVLSGHATSALRLAGVPMVSADALVPWLAGTAWIASIVLVVLAWRLMRDLYITTRGYARRFHQGCKRIWRNAARRSTIAARLRDRAGNSIRIEPTFSEEINLGELEYAVLHHHRELSPGRTLSAMDVAESVGVSVSRAKEAFESLSMLQLVAVSSMSHPDGVTHRLTPQGEAFLAACSGAVVDPLGKRKS